MENGKDKPEMIDQSKAKFFKCCETGCWANTYMTNSVKNKKSKQVVKGDNNESINAISHTVIRRRAGVYVTKVNKARLLDSGYTVQLSD